MTRRQQRDVTLSVAKGNGATSDALKFEVPGRGYALVRLGTPEQVAGYLTTEFGEDDPLAEHIFESEWGNPIAYLEWITTYEHCRGRGAAESLLKHVLRWLDENGIVATYGYSAPGEDEDQRRLLQWYLGHGFSLLNEWEDGLGDAVPILRTA